MGVWRFVTDEDSTTVAAAAAAVGWGSGLDGEFMSDAAGEA
jgi:hypothetical protein